MVHADVIAVVVIVLGVPATTAGLWALRAGPMVARNREVRYEELAVVQLVSSPNRGVRLAVKGSPDAVVFWTYRSRTIADCLEVHNVLVDRTEVSLREAGGTHRTW